jgi:NADH:ubiquinone reductase (H+-translocating)
MTMVHRVVVIGAGFGGLRVARGLAGAPVEVTIVDANNFHTFQPLLYQVATAGLDLDDIAYPVRGIFRRQRNVSVRMAAVTGVDLRHGASPPIAVRRSSTTPSSWPRER